MIGAMDVYLTRVWEELAGRVGGPFTLRFVVQPIVAVVLGIRAGRRDAARARRQTGYAGAITDVGRLWVLAFAMDGVYHAVVLRAFHPLQSFVVSVLLALVPYFVARISVRSWAARRRH